jgi:hypothetical protein
MPPEAAYAITALLAPALAADGRGLPSGGSGVGGAIDCGAAQRPPAGTASLSGEVCFVGAVDHDAVLSALRLAIGAYALREEAAGQAGGGGGRGRGRGLSRGRRAAVGDGNGAGREDDTEGRGGGEACEDDTEWGGAGEAGLDDTEGGGGGQTDGLIATTRRAGGAGAEPGGGALLMDWERQGLRWTAAGAILDRHGQMLHSPGG